VVAKGILASDFFSDPEELHYDCANIPFDEVEGGVEFTTPEPGTGETPMLLIDSDDLLHVFDTNCPTTGGPWIRLINISPQVSNARIIFNPTEEDPTPVDLFGAVAPTGVLYGTASDYVQIPASILNDDGRLLGAWDYHDGAAVDPFRTDPLSFGAQDVSVAQVPQIGGCHSIIFWQNPANGGSDSSILTVDEPALCERWGNRSGGAGAPQNKWSSETGCAFPE